MIIKQTNYVEQPGVVLPQEDYVEREGYIPLERQIDMQRIAGARLRIMQEALARGDIPYEDVDGRVEDVVDDADDDLDVAMVANVVGAEVERYNAEYERIIESGQHPYVETNQFLSQQGQLGFTESVQEAKMGTTVPKAL